MKKLKLIIIIYSVLIFCTVLSVVFVISGAVYWHFIYNPPIETPMWDANIEFGEQIIAMFLREQNREYEQNVERIHAVVDSMLKTERRLK